MSFSEAAPELTEFIQAKPLETSVSEEKAGITFETQLSFDLISCQQIETGTITTPSHKEATQSDFNYALKSMVDLVREDVETQKETLMRLNPSRKTTLAYELTNIISELNDFKAVKEVTAENLRDTLYAAYDTLEGRGLQVLCSRVAYFLMIRLMLIHYWKTLNLIDHDEKNPYQDPNLTINQILKMSAPNLIKEKHNWLFAKQNNYSWYKMSFNTLNEIENLLSFWEFRDESISIFSFLYEKYLDENRLRKYAHYTPPLLVRFIWDFLLDQTKSPSLFRPLGKNRVPKLVFDPTMGSGNFLIEAARIFQSELEESETNPIKRVQETMTAMTTGLYGCDIDAFAHFFSEIKLLWKLSPFFKKNQELGIMPHQRVNPSLSIIHQNALKLYNKIQLDMIEPEEKEPELSTDTQFGILPLEGHLKTVHSKIRVLEKFDLCVGCPPEQILNQQKKYIKEIIQKISFWKKHYESPLLYSAWFFILGLSKLREGGKLIYLTETYWPSEEGASKLREYMLSEAKVLCVIDLGPLKLDEDTTPLPRYVTLLEKCSSKEERDNHKIKIIKVRPQEKPLPASFILGKILSKSKLIERPGKIFADDDIDIYFSGVNQGELDGKPWQQIYDTGFSEISKQILQFKTTLTYFLSIEENKEVEKEEMALVTPEVATCNHFSVYKDKPEGNFVSLIPKPISKESPYYILALLNSPVLNFWYENNGNKKSGKKLFNPSALKMIPIRPIDFGSPMEESLHKEKLAQIESAIQKFDEKYLMANITLELTHGREEMVHDSMVLMQKEILNIEKNLKRYDSFFKESFSNLKEATLCPLYDPLAFRSIFPPDNQCSLKDQKQVFIHKENVLNPEQYSLAHFKRQPGVKNEGEHLILISRDNKVIKIYAEKEILDFVEQDLPQQIHNFWDEIESALLIPKNLEEFRAFKEDIVNHCLKFKEKEMKLKSILHHLIYKLYGFEGNEKAIQMMEAAY